MQHLLTFLPLPQGQTSLRPILRGLKLEPPRRSVPARAIPLVASSITSSCFQGKRRLSPNLGRPSSALTTRPNQLPARCTYFLRSQCAASFLAASALGSDPQ